MREYTLMLVDTLAKMAVDEAVKNELEFEDYMVGLKYSYVVVNGPGGRGMGVAYMPAEDMSRGFAREPRWDTLIEMVRAKNMQEKSLAVAAINAISQYVLWNGDMIEGVVKKNIVEHIPECCPHGKIVVIGNMVPLVRKLREMGEVEVLERNPKLRYGAYPDSLSPRVIPEADVLIITGATLINDSIDQVLSLAKGRKFLVGPTAGIYPKWLRGYVDIVAGTKIVDIEKTKKIIKMGGGRWDIADYCEEYVLNLNYF